MGKQASQKAISQKSKLNASQSTSQPQLAPEPGPEFALTETTLQRATQTPSALTSRQVLQLQRTMGNRAVSGMLPRPVSQIRRAVIQRVLFGEEGTKLNEEVSNNDVSPEEVLEYLNKNLPDEGTIETDTVATILKLFGQLLNKDKKSYSIVVNKVSKGQVETLLGSVSDEYKEKYKDNLEEFKTERMVHMGTVSVGNQKWAGSDASNAFTSKEELLQPSGTDFDKWILGKGKEPSSTATMNCWEAVMFVAYKAGVMPLSFIQLIHAEATKQSLEQYKTNMDNRYLEESKEYKNAELRYSEAMKFHLEKKVSNLNLEENESDSEEEELDSDKQFLEKERPYLGSGMSYLEMMEKYWNLGQTKNQDDTEYSWFREFSKSRAIDAHTDSAFQASAGAYTKVLAEALGADKAKEWDGESEIPRGNLVFFDGFQGHTAMSLGTVVEKKHPIMSLWTKPTKTTVKSDSIQLTTIEDIVTSMKKKSVKITYAKAPWI